MESIYTTHMGGMDVDALILKFSTIYFVKKKTNPLSKYLFLLVKKKTLSNKKRQQFNG